ncbi:hypothetical protein GQ600_19720 [Phytophthora cactorum]|nr:hypothetical protein GQ600_19720 [Phytophthora cactorum]
MTPASSASTATTERNTTRPPTEDVSRACHVADAGGGDDNDSGQAELLSRHEHERRGLSGPGPINDFDMETRRVSRLQEEAPISSIDPSPHLPVSHEITPEHTPDGDVRLVAVPALMEHLQVYKFTRDGHGGSEAVVQVKCLGHSDLN